MTTYNKARYHTREGRAKQKANNKRLARKRQEAWAWLLENRPDVIEKINNKISKEMK